MNELKKLEVEAFELVRTRRGGLIVVWPTIGSKVLFSDVQAAKATRPALLLLERCRCSEP